MEATQHNSLIPANRTLHWLLVGILLSVALGIRLWRADQPWVEFHPMRQYRSGNIARGIYAQWDNALPEWEREIAVINLHGEELLEPRLLETLVAATYLIAGEHFWASRLYSSLFWVGGGFLLYLLARALFTEDTAFFAAMFYLFLPFAVTASRTFQPDSLMILFIMGGLYLIWRHHTDPRWKWLILAGLTCGFALFIKPLGIFVLSTAFLVLAWDRQRSVRWVIKPQTLTFFGLSYLPVGSYYLYSIFIGLPLLGEARAQFVPGLLLKAPFWIGWFEQMAVVIGPLVFVGALLGFLVVKARRVQVYLGGLWIGYMLFVLVFTYVVSTHNYYQLQLVPIVALSLCPLIDRVLEPLRAAYRQTATRIMFTVLLVVVAAILSLREVVQRHSTGVYFNLDPALIPDMEEIGELTDHSSRTVTLSLHYSRPLRYHARIAGLDWPTTGELAILSYAQDRPQQSIADYINEVLSPADYDYFVVTNMVEWERQPALQVWLCAYPVLAETDHYIIFDLQKGTVNPSGCE